MDSLVRIKSNRYGLEILMDEEAPFTEVLTSLEEHLKDSAQFFQGAKIAVTFYGRELTDPEENAALNLITDVAGLDVVCILDEDSNHELAYKSLVDQTLSYAQKQEGQFFKGSLKNGQQILSDSSVVILGDVDPGAEVIAKGNVIVFGMIQGKIHAGSEGDDQAYVVALSLKPSELWIGQVQARCQRIYQESLEIKGAQIAIVDGSHIYVDSLSEYWPD